jgi:Domain of unknown function (DUF4214)
LSQWRRSVDETTPLTSPSNNGWGVACKGASILPRAQGVEFSKSVFVLFTQASKSSMNNSPLLSPSLETLGQVLELYDEEFVIKAYEVILGRAPDPGGLTNYLRQVRTGVHKAQILVELAQSAEGRAKCVDLSPVRKSIPKYRNSPPSIWNRILQRLSWSAIEPIERQQRVISNKLYLAERQTVAQAMQLSELLTLVQQTTQQLATQATQLSELLTLVQQTAQQSVSYLASSTSGHSTPNSPARQSLLESELCGSPSVAQMSSGAREIFAALARAADPRLQE